jgi:hypothetical protein
MKPGERALLFEKLLKYVLPTQSNITSDIDRMTDDQIETMYQKIIDNLNTPTDENTIG